MTIDGARASVAFNDTAQGGEGGRTERAARPREERDLFRRPASPVREGVDAGMEGEKGGELALEVGELLEGVCHCKGRAGLSW